MAHTKIGRNKKTCEKYKQLGKRELNKKIKQERHEKRLAYFKERRENPREKIKVDPIILEGLGLSVPNNQPNYNSNQPKHTEYARWKSAMGKLDYELAKEKAAEKAKERQEKNKK